MKTDTKGRAKKHVLPVSKGIFRGFNRGENPFLIETGGDMDTHCKAAELEAIRAELKQVLMKYCKDDLKCLERLSHHSNWPEHATQAMSQEGDPHAFLDELTGDALAAIAEGKVDVAALALEVRPTLKDWGEMELQAFRAEIKEVLWGFGANHAERLDRLLHHQNWPAHATYAMSQKRDPHVFLERVSYDALEAIAEGKVDVAALALEVRPLLQAQADDADNGTQEDRDAPSEDTQAELEAIETRIQALLIGYSDDNLRVLEQLAHYKQWEADASEEMAYRRPRRLFQELSLTDLRAIAKSQIDVAALASNAIQTVKQQRVNRLLARKK